MKTKLLLKIFFVLFAFTCLGTSAKTDVWTFDKTAVSGNTAVNSTNYADYLPDGWYAPSYNYGFAILPIDGKQYLISTVSQRYNERFLPFYARKGTLTVKARARFGSSATYQIHIYKATQNGDSFTAGESVVDGTIAVDKNDKDFTYTIPEDGYYAFSAQSGTAVLSVSNTYEAAAQTYTVSGTVVDVDGVPLAEANVTLGGSSAGTDAEGKYSLADIADGNYDLTVAKEGYENASVSVTVSGADLTVDPVTLRVEKWNIAGYVQDYDRNRIAGAAMQLYLGETMLEEATSDGEGNYRFEIPAREESYTLRIQAPYFKDVTYTVDVSREYLDSEKVWVFNPSLEAVLVSFNLTVRDAWNEPVHGATVTINGENLDNRTVLESGNSGVYVLRNQRAINLKDNEYVWTVSAEGYDTATGTAVFSGNSVNTAVTLIPTGMTVVSGTVTDTEGNALAGAHVSLTIGDASVPAASVDTNAEGFYAFARNDIEGSVIVEAELDYYSGDIKEIAEITSNAGNVCDFTLSEIVYTYTATVRNEAGESLAGAIVVFDGGELTGENGVFSTTIKAKDAAGREIPVEVVCEGYQTQTRRLTFSRDISETYTLRKAEVSMTEVLLEVSNHDKAGVEGAAVRIFTEGYEAVVEDWGEGAYYAEIPTESNMGKTFTVEIRTDDYKDYTTTFVVDGNPVDLAIELEVKDPDGVDAVFGDDGGDTVIFTVDGLRVEVREGGRLPAGLYIVNGRKTVVR